MIQKVQIIERKIRPKFVSCNEFLKMTKKYHGGEMKNFYRLTKSLIFKGDSDSN